MKVEIVSQPALRVAAVHHVGPYQRISEAFEKLSPIVRQAGLFREQSSLIAVYHDDPTTTPEAELRSDAGITVPDETPLPSGLTEVRLPAGRYGTTTHRGPYTTLGDTWARLRGEWLQHSGERLGKGLSYELYRNNPGNASPDQLITDLFIPLA